MSSLLHNEFAAISVSVDLTGNGPRLRLEDHRSERVRFVDPLELEGLVWASDDLLRRLVDPSERWGGEG